jgi:predicted transcriptional regulator
MDTYSTNEVAKQLGITGAALSKYIAAGKIPAPTIVQVGRMKLHSWTEEDIERARELLPKIANGRKTRHKTKQIAVGSQQLAKSKTKKPPPSTAVPHKNKKK